MYEILVVIFLIIAIAIIALVLVQKGKGADMGASFGAGASATLFGSAGTGNFLTRTTTVLGVMFFILSICLANFAGKKHVDDTFYKIDDDVSTSVQQTDTNNTSDKTSSEDTVTEQKPNNPTSDIPE